jgi:hypothetical protein
MALARWQATIVDDRGNIRPGATIDVFRESNGSRPSLKSDRDGVVPLPNPFAADSEGYAAFHVLGGLYRIVATSGGESREWRYVGVGTAGEQDIASGIVGSRVTGSGTIPVGPDDRGYQVESSVNGDVTFQLGLSAERLGLPFTVVLVGADPVAHTIKVDLSGSETVRGSGEFVFESLYQVVTFYPLAAGGGYYIG